MLQLYGLISRQIFFLLSMLACLNFFYNVKLIAREDVPNIHVHTLCYTKPIEFFFFSSCQQKKVWISSNIPGGCTVFIQIVAAPTINFSLAWVRLLIKGGSYSRAAFINFGPILDGVIHKNCSTEG